MRSTVSSPIAVSAVLLAALLACVASVRAAAPVVPDVEQLRIKHEKIVLPNGLTVLVHEDHSVPLVAVNVWYHVGSRDERRGRTGFAHLSERLGGFGGRSDVLAESQVYYGDSEAYLQRLRNLATLSPAQVQATAQTWLSRHHATLIVEPFPNLRAGKDDFDRKQLPALAAPPKVVFPQMQRGTLSNGMKVVLLERHSVPLVSMALALDAGVSADPATAPGTSRFALDLLLKGTTSRDTYRLADERDALGATLSVGNSLDQSFVYMGALRANLGGSLDLLADVARNPAFPAEMIDIQRKQQLAAIEQQRANPSGAVQRLLPQLLYGPDHAYGIPGGSLGTQASVSKLQRAELLDWHRRWFTPSNATLVVAGDITLAALMPELERSFGGWRGGAGQGFERAEFARTRQGLSGRQTRCAAVGHHRRAPRPDRRYVERSRPGNGDAQLRRHGHLALEPQSAS